MNTIKITPDLRVTIENAQNALNELERNPERPDTVVINGLKWDRENTVIEDREHFNYYEALKIAQANGKRLPTQEEWEALIDLGSTWDKEKQGIWLGNDHKLKADSKESIFLPAAGSRNYSSGALRNRGYNGYYWSTRKSSGSNACRLRFSSSSENVYRTHRNLGFSVRFINLNKAKKIANKQIIKQS
ncbi:MAG: hypothetical protein LBG15_09360 [Dysgonamonadaceae bacterium]|jgi:uncharacterized protein (TIGR02145 family)|nr:hypothetical protein [Dysgonamonadaceae bacterium]